jgi:predicted MFS family arabinose efflux permease
MLDEQAGEPRRGLWANRDFVRLWTGQAISEMGSRISREGIPYTALLVLHASTVQMGWLAALGGAAMLVFGLPAGVWVDRRRRRPILIGADLGRMLLLGSVPAAALAGVLGMPQLYAVTALAGVLTVFFNVAYQSHLPALVEREQMLEANSRLTLSATIAEICGPGLTGALVQLITAPLAIAFDALSFAVSALSVALIRRREPPPAPRQEERVWAEALAGLRFIRDEPALRALGLRSLTAFFCHGMIGALYLLYFVDELHLRPAVLGLCIAVGGASATAGTFAAPHIARRLGLGPTFVAASVGIGLATLLIPLAGAAPTLVLPCLIGQQLIGDLLFAVYMIHEVTLRQLLAPDHLLGRVNAGMQLLAFGILPLGAVAGGYLAARAGVRTTLALAAAGLLASTIWLLASPLRRLR